MAVYAPNQGVVPFHVAVDTKENEIATAPVLVQHLAVPGMPLTGDVMFTQRALSTQIAEARGDDLWMVNDNQPILREEIEVLVEPACVSASWSTPPGDFTTKRSLVVWKLSLRHCQFRLMKVLAFSQTSSIGFWSGACGANRKHVSGQVVSAVPWFWLAR